MNCSVCLSTSDRPQLLNVALLSLLYQRFCDEFEVIVIDDGNIKADAVDSNIIMMDKFSKCGISFRYVQTAKKVGWPIVRNIGIDEAKYDIIIELDDDHYCDSLFIKNITDPFGKLSNIGCVGALMPTPKYLPVEVRNVDNSFIIGDNSCNDQLYLYIDNYLYTSYFLRGVMCFNRNNGIRYRENFSIIGHGAETLFGLEFVLGEFNNYVASNAICFHFQDRDVGGGCWDLPIEEATKLRDQDTAVFNKWLDDIPGARELATKLGVLI